MIIRARERKEEKSICSSRLSRSCFTLSTESIVVSVSICELAYTASQETIHGFQQIRCRGANNHHYCEGNEEEPNLARN